MKRIVAAAILFAGCSMFADDNTATGTAAKPARFDFQLPESIEMPNGEIYNHPKVVDVKPNGITIMHDNGAAFWYFSQLPDAVRDKFHYNPVEAQKYTDEMLLRRQKLDEMKLKQQFADADHKVYVDLVSQRYTCQYLKMRIDATVRQLNSDKRKIQDLKSDINQDRKVLATDADQQPAPTTTNNGYWITSSSSNDDESDRGHVIGEFDEDWKNSKTDYDMWTTAKDALTNNLVTYQQEYKEAVDKRNQLEAQWAEIQKKRQIDSGKLDQDIHRSVKQEIQGDLQKLNALRSMRDQKLITQDEYIKAKADVLKRF